ncbi:hypothetical protein MQC57_22645 [Escherichia coli]|nr:hypothetical protein [Escherichia coli]
MLFTSFSGSLVSRISGAVHRDNTTFPVADYYPHLPVFVTKTPGAGENLLFPVSGGTTEHCERVSYDVPVIADQPLLYS